MWKKKTMKLSFRPLSSAMSIPFEGNQKRTRIKEACIVLNPSSLRMRDQTAQRV